MRSPSEIASTTSCRRVSFTCHLFDEPRQRASQRHARRVGSRLDCDERQLHVAVAKYRAANDKRLIFLLAASQIRTITFLLLRRDGQRERRWLRGIGLFARHFARSRLDLRPANDVQNPVLNSKPQISLQRLLAPGVE